LFERKPICPVESKLADHRHSVIGRGNIYGRCPEPVQGHERDSTPDVVPSHLVEYLGHRVVIVDYDLEQTGSEREHVNSRLEIPLEI
jgi:hypothetical protein